MLTSKPICPRCGEDDLWRPPGQPERLRCRECGYDSQPAHIDNGDTLKTAPYVKMQLSALNIDDLEQRLAQLERKLVPLLNQVRAMRGKAPVKVTE